MIFAALLYRLATSSEHQLPSSTEGITTDKMIMRLLKDIPEPEIPKFANAPVPPPVQE